METLRLVARSIERVVFSNSQYRQQNKGAGLRDILEPLHFMLEEQSCPFKYTSVQDVRMAVM